jgi:hypothetical protein
LYAKHNIISLRRGKLVTEENNIGFTVLDKEKEVVVGTKPGRH